MLVKINAFWFCVQSMWDLRHLAGVGGGDFFLCVWLFVYRYYFVDDRLLIYSSATTLVSVSIKCVKAGVNMNGSEIWSSNKKGIVRIKTVGNTTTQLTPPPPPRKEKKKERESPRLVGDSLVSIYKFFTSNFNFPNLSNTQHFIIFFNLTYPFRKKYLFSKIPKNHLKIYTKLPNSG